MTTPRSFAGFVLSDDGDTIRFGVEYRAQNRSGERASVVLVDPELADTPGFAPALARAGARATSLSNANIVRVLHVGRAKDDALVVVCSRDVIGYRLEECAPTLPLPLPLALAVARDVLSALAYAHTVGAVHGGVHARSVVIGTDGRARLADWGLALALAQAASSGGDPELLRGLRGYVAPELALGEEPGPPTDVFAAGAFAEALCGASAGPALIGVLRRAQVTDESKRFTSGRQLLQAFERAAVQDGVAMASAAQMRELAARACARPESESLDEATEGLLADLQAQAQPQRPKKATIDGVLDELDEPDEPDELEGETDVVDPASGEVPVKPSRDPGDYTGELTAVDDEAPQLSDDPISEIIRGDSLADIDRDASGKPARASVALEPTLPVPTIEDPGAGDDRARRVDSGPVASDFGEDHTPLPEPRPFHLDPTRTISTDAIKRHQSTASGLDDSADFVLPKGLPKKRSALFWLGLMAFAAASAVGILYARTDLLHRGRATAREVDRERLRDKALADLQSERQRPGTVALSTEGDDAAIWLLLGRTPLTSFPVPTAMVHELRIEHDGYHPADLRVMATHWAGPKNARLAQMAVSLVEGTPDAPPPAFPAESDSPAAPGGPGLGRIEVSSSPSGASVWMLVGFGPEAEIAGIAAGETYQLRVLRDGYRPAFLSIEADEWFLAGPGSPIVPRLERTVELQPIESSGKGAGKNRRKRRRRGR